MEYVIAVLTNGRRDLLARSLAAFFQHVEPKPARGFLMDDGGQSRAASLPDVPSLDELLAATGIEWQYDSSPSPLGMCRAMAHCWHAAASSDLPWVFTLEDDFVILRPVNLLHLAEVIDAEPTLTQMALVRCPWGFEIPHGGYIAQEPSWYKRRQTGQGRWISTVRNWANCPALFRTSLAREFPWPLENGCETTIGPMIRAVYPDAVFGLYGAGEPWCSHIGVERAPGSHGY